MPELPEVETVGRDLQNLVVGKRVVEARVIDGRLRYAVPKSLPKILAGKVIKKIRRRGRYLIWEVTGGFLIIHLGMSGVLTVSQEARPLQKHDKLILVLADKSTVSYNDVRGFGLISWTTEDPEQYYLLKKLGPEPFDQRFSASYLSKMAVKRSCSVKQFIMDNQVVTGVGNIYAAEILFAAKIFPLAKTNKISSAIWSKLVTATKKILKSAIKYRGTTISDYADGFGNSGKFQSRLKVYGRAGLACVTCQTKLETIKVAQRATVFCSKCQCLGK